MKKKTYIEFLRILAAFLVIVNHTNSSIFLNRIPGLTWLCSVAYFFVCKIAVPVFLLIMGALLLPKEDTPRQSVWRFLRILIVFCISSLLYYVYYQCRNGAAFNIRQFLLSLPANHVTNAYWYFYLYLALLCMLPILQKLVKALSKRQLGYLIFLSLGVYGTTALISVFFPNLRMSGFFFAGLVGPYIGQVLLGYYLDRYVSLSRARFWIAFCVFIFLILAQTAGTFLLYQRNPPNYLALDDRTMITITTAAACVFYCFKYLFTQYPPHPKLDRAISAVGRLAFGIYLLGDFMIALSAPINQLLCERMHVLPAMLLWEVFIFTACALITAGLRLIPPLRKFL